MAIARVVEVIDTSGLRSSNGFSPLWHLVTAVVGYGIALSFRIVDSPGNSMTVVTR
ncbi:SMR family transporter [Rhodococcus sp. NPDC059968]|uniref:SMR family transporter n=1 Tax=Rhodococcus sp. NPDC059968 TaxID=3347017 RepID=UPI00366D961F